MILSRETREKVGQLPYQEIGTDLFTSTLAEILGNYLDYPTIVTLYGELCQAIIFPKHGERSASVNYKYFSQDVASDLNDSDEPSATKVTLKQLITELNNEARGGVSFFELVPAFALFTAIKQLVKRQS